MTTLEACPTTGRALVALHGGGLQHAEHRNDAVRAHADCLQVLPYECHGFSLRRSSASNIRHTNAISTLPRYWAARTGSVRPVALVRGRHAVALMAPCIVAEKVSAAVRFQLLRPKVVWTKID